MANVTAKWDRAKWISSADSRACPSWLLFQRGSPSTLFSNSEGGKRALCTESCFFHWPQLALSLLIWLLSSQVTQSDTKTKILFTFVFPKKITMPGIEEILCYLILIDCIALQSSNFTWRHQVYLFILVNPRSFSHCSASIKTQSPVTPQGSLCLSSSKIPASLLPPQFNSLLILGPSRMFPTFLWA